MFRAQSYLFSGPISLFHLRPAFFRAHIYKLTSPTYVSSDLFPTPPLCLFTFTAALTLHYFHSFSLLDSQPIVQLIRYFDSRISPP